MKKKIKACECQKTSSLPNDLDWTKIALNAISDLERQIRMIELRRKELTELERLENEIKRTEIIHFTVFGFMIILSAVGLGYLVSLFL